VTPQAKALEKKAWDRYPLPTTTTASASTSSTPRAPRPTMA